MVHTAASAATVALREAIRDTGKRVYVLAFSMRSGSTALAHDLEQWGLGLPLEYFQPNLYLRRHGGPGPSAHLLESIRRAPGDVFGFKISWEQAFVLAESLAAEDVHVDGPDLRAVVPGLTYLHLSRRDKAGQAVSAWRAERTGHWHRPVEPDGGAPGSAPEPRPVEAGYGDDEDDDPGDDLAAVRDVLLQLLAEDWLWHDFLARTGITATALVYEDYLADRRGVLRRVAAALGLPPAGEVPDPRTEIMRDGRSAELAARLRDHLHRPAHPFWVGTAATGTG
ncbi:MAG: Stf0 family sulfotransferase [Acidimicrobiia bacterium]